MIHKNYDFGFTLTELLIGLAILGVIATFTIPKIIQAQQSQSFNAKAKEAAATISAAYQLYQLNNSVTPTTKASDITQYMNYISISVAGNIDSVQTGNHAICSATAMCIKFHNGAILMPYDPAGMGGTDSTNAMLYFFDPDGQITDGTTNGPGKSIIFFIYYNGQIKTYGEIPAGTVSSDTVRTPCPTCDPPWFSW